jgi:hypothetical protein
MNPKSVLKAAPVRAVIMNMAVDARFDGAEAPTKPGRRMLDEDVFQRPTARPPKAEKPSCTPTMPSFGAVAPKTSAVRKRPTLRADVEVMLADRRKDPRSE